MLPEHVIAFARFRSSGAPATPPSTPPAHVAVLPTRKRVRESERLSEATVARRRAGVEWTIRRACREVSLIEAVVDVIRGRWIVQIKALVERERLKQVLSSRMNVTRFEHQVLRQLILPSQVELLHVRRFQIAIDCAKLKRLGDVSRRCNVESRIARDARVVADL